MRETIKIKRIVYDEYIKSFKEIYGEIYGELEKFEIYSKNKILNNEDYKEPKDYILNKNKDGGIQEINISERCLKNILSQELAAQRKELLESLKESIMGDKEKIERYIRLEKVVGEIINYYDTSLFTTTEISKGLCSVKRCNEILMTKEIISECEGGHTLNGIDSKYGEIINNQNFMTTKTYVKWSIKGLGYIRKVVSESLEEEEKEKVLKAMERYRKKRKQKKALEN